MTNLYFECNSGISGDMAVGALLDLGADKEKLIQALKSINLDSEFEYIIEKKQVNSILTTDFDVIINHKHHHTHRNLNDINKIIESTQISNNSKNLAKKIFNIIAKAECKVHNKSIEEIHFHEVGAIDSIVDIIAFSVLFDDLNPKKVYCSTLCDGIGSIECQHGLIPVPAPAVCEIIQEYRIPIKITDIKGEMITPTGAGIIAAIKSEEKLPKEGFIIEKIGKGRGKRNYPLPLLRVYSILDNQKNSDYHNN